MSLPKNVKSSKSKTIKKKATGKRKKVADLRMSEKSSRGNGMYTPTIKVGTQTPLTLDMSGSFVWGKYKPKGSNYNGK
jgi:hypothetical protein